MKNNPTGPIMTTTTTPVRRSTRLTYAPEVYRFLEELVREAGSSIGEIAWCGLIDTQDDGTIHVSEVFVPAEQEASRGLVEAEHFFHQVMDVLIERGREADIERLRYFGHSHHSMDRHPSGTDTDFWEEAARTVGRMCVVSIWNYEGVSAWVTGPIVGAPDVIVREQIPVGASKREVSPEVARIVRQVREYTDRMRRPMGVRTSPGWLSGPSRWVNQPPVTPREESSENWDNLLEGL